MPIRQQVQSNLETIAGFEAAADEKYEGGFTLLATTSPGNGVYLMGYAAEMLLKSAYFRLYGFDSQRNIRMSDFDYVASRHNLVPSSEKYHNLTFWTDAIIGERVLAGVTDAVLETELAVRTTRLSTNWSVRMRYMSLQGILKQDLEDVLDDVVWIKSNHSKLWS